MNGICPEFTPLWDGSDAALRSLLLSPRVGLCGWRQADDYHHFRLVFRLTEL